MALLAAGIMAGGVTAAPPGEAAAHGVEDPAAARHLADAATPQPAAWDHNISGHVVFQGRTEAVHPLIWHIQLSVNQGVLPLFVSIQEACRPQVDALLTYLQTNVHPSYTVNFRNSLTVAEPCGDSGNAVYVLDGIPPDVSDQGTFTQQGEEASSRGWVCMRSRWGYTGCTSHLICPRSCGDSAKAAEIRQFQLREYRQAALQKHQQTGGKPVYWSGDFYIEPDQMGASFPEIIRENREADECREVPTNWQNTQDSGNGKVDWLFLTEAAVSPCPHDASVIPANIPSGNQDHHIVASYHRWAEGGVCEGVDAFRCASLNRTPGRLQAVGSIDDHTSGSKPVALQAYLEVNTSSGWRIVASGPRVTGTEYLVVTTIPYLCTPGMAYRSRINWNWNDGAGRGTVTSGNVVCTS